MPSFIHDVRYALRSLTKHPALWVAVSLTLSIGIGASAGVFSVVNTYLLRPLPFPEADALVHLWSVDRNRSSRSAEVTLLDYEDLRRESRALGLASFTHREVAISDAARAEEIDAAEISVGLTELLQVQPIRGRTITHAEGATGERVVLLSEQIWRTVFGADESMLGRTVRLNGEAHTVIGVMPGGFAFPLPTTRAWVPQRPLSPDRVAPRLRVVGRIATGMSATDARAELDRIGSRLAKEYPTTNSTRQFTLVPLRQGLTFAYDRVSGLARILSVAAFLLLVLVCVNVANLMLTRAVSRHREIALRAAMGGSWLHEVRLMLSEAAILASCGATLGLMIGYAISRGLAAAIPSQVYRVGEVGLGGAAVGFTVVIATIAALLISVAPVLESRRGQSSEHLREGVTSAPGVKARRRFLWLAAAQVSAATILLIGALLMARSLSALRNVDLGFDSDRVAVVEIRLPEFQYSDQERQRSFVTAVVNRIQAVPGVDRVAVANFLPVNNEHRWRPFEIENISSDPQQRPMALELAVSSGYFGVMGVAVNRGRDFGDGDEPSAPPVAIVNETFVASNFNGRDPIGQRIAFSEPNTPPAWRTIVGVSADSRQVSAADGARPQIFVPYNQVPWSYFRFLVKTSAEPTSYASVLRTIVREQDPDVAIRDIRTLDAVVSSSFTPQRLVTVSLVGFAVAALLLAGVGVYGLLAYSTSLRAREFGIRVAIGAQRTQILMLVLRQTLALTALGVLVGMLAARALSGQMNRFLFGVQTGDLATWVVAGAFITAIALLAAVVPAYRASRASPMSSLR